MQIDEHLTRRPRGLLRWPVYTMSQLYKPAYARLEAALADDGITLRGYQVLVCLEAFGGMSQQQVSDLIRVDRSDMVRILDRLEEQGYVVRERDVADRRRHVLVLTQAGRGAIVQGDRVVERINAEELARLSDDERRELHRLLLRAIGEHEGVLDESFDRSTGNGHAPDGA